MNKEKFYPSLLASQMESNWLLNIMESYTF